MKLRTVFKLSEKFILDNSPAILSGIAVAGTVSVAYLTGKATFKAADVLAEEAARIADFEDAVRPSFNNKDKVRLVWKQYIPPAIAAVTTIGCIVSASTISASRLAGMAAAYKVVEKQYEDYKDKAKEILGEKKSEDVKDAVHADVISRHPLPREFQEEYSFASPGAQQWCFDLLSGRYFRSDMQTIRSIGNDVNARLIEETYVRLSEFYDALGLPETKMSGEIGWTLEHPLDLKFSSQLADGNGGVPVLVVDFARNPTTLRDYKFFPGCENPY